MGTENELNTDLINIMTDFNKIKECYMREHTLRQKYEGITKHLQEENKIVRDLEKAGRNKMNMSRDFVIQQQDTISCLLEVKSENIKLSEHIIQLEASLADLKKQLEDEKEKWQTNQEKMKSSQNQEMEELKLSSEKRVMEAEREVEDIKAKFHAQYSELAKKLENIQNEKSNEINMIVFEYEERLHKMEERLSVTEAESQQIRDRAAADVVLYQKKVLALEQQYNNMIQGKEKSPLSAPPSSPLPPNSSENFVPGTRRRNKSFTYHIPSNVNQSQPSGIPLHSILKKISAYNSVQSSSDKENLLPSPNDLIKHENVGARDDKPVEYITATISAEKSTSSVMPVSSDRFAGNSSVATRSSIMPHLQFVTEPPDLDTTTNAGSRQQYNPPSQGKRTRFAAAKKRKLFCCNQDTL